MACPPGRRAARPRRRAVADHEMRGHRGARPELVDRERVVVRVDTARNDHTLDVVDDGSTGDEVLDQVLHVLAGGRVAAVDHDVSLGNRVWGARARGGGCWRRAP